MAVLSVLSYGQEKATMKMQRCGDGPTTSLGNQREGPEKDGGEAFLGAHNASRNLQMGRACCIFMERVCATRESLLVRDPTGGP